jgi:hypothetical protein
MAFPVSPTEGQTFTENNTVWIYSAVTDQWNRSVINPLNETTYIGSDGAPGGIGGATQVIFNDNGSLASDAGLVYNKTTDVLTTGSLRTTSLGTAAAPGIAFASDPNTGIYSPGADQLAVATNGTQKLLIDSSGNITVTGGSITNNTAAGVSGNLVFNQSGVGLARVGMPASVNALVFDTWTGAALTEKMRVTSAGLVGIGTSIPGQLLEIAATSNPQMRFTDTGDYYYDIGITSSNKFSISPAGSPALTVVAGGDVGIGTTSPGGKLHISETFATAGTKDVLRLQSASGVDSAVMRIGGYAYTGNARAAIDFLQNGGTNFQSQLIFSTSAGADAIERARIDSSGNVGIGTSSVGARLHIRDGSNVNLYGAANGAAFQWTAVNDSASAYIDYIQNALTVQFQTGGSERARIDSSGRLLVGTSSSSGLIRAAFQANTGNSAGAGVVHLQRGEAAAAITVDEILGSLRGTDNADNIGAEINFVADATWGSGDYPGRLVFSTTADGASSPTERMRITQSGHTSLIASNNVFYVGSSGTAGTAETIYQGAHSATIGTSFSGTVSFSVFTNGNVQNTNNSYTAISDIKLKENIVDANSQWDDLKSLRVRNYNLKEGQTHTQIGLVAQEVEPISPGLVYEFPDRDEDGNDLGTVTKSVNYSVLYMKAVKALQEAMERIESLEAKVAALEAQ